MPFPLIPAALALAQYVPAITRWLSGDSPGPIAETIASIATTVTGQTTVQGAVNAIASEPDKRRAFELAIQERADELERAYLADRQSARDRDTKIQLARGRNRRGDILAALAISALIFTIGLLFFGGEIPDKNRDLLLVTVGALIALVKDVYGFEFGSSKEASRGMNSVAEYVQRNGKS